MFDKKFVDFRWWIFEYVIHKNLYTAKKWCWYAQLNIFNNEVAMTNMSTQDIEGIRQCMNVICDKMIEYIKDEKNYIYPNKVISSKYKHRIDTCIRDRKIKEEYNKKWWITLAILANRYNISWERVRQILNKK